jgi:hypothetical protein
MKAKLGMFAVQLSGSVGGTTAAKNRYGTYFKKKSHPINRKTTSQSAVRAFFSTLTKGWKSLTSTQRFSWTSAVENFSKHNSLAETIILTGHQLYIAINRNLQTISQALLTSAPAVTTVTPLLTQSIAAAAGAGTMLDTYTPAVPAGQSYTLYATRPLSAGKKSNSQDYKLIAVINTADASPFDIKAAYEAVFGAGWRTAGQQIFFKGLEISKTTGENTVSFFSSTIVAA